MFEKYYNGPPGRAGYSASFGKRWLSCKNRTPTLASEEGKNAAG